tara:strand:- start:3541 stop:4104 length:564 start_codon:yes stop_codon:yes gene_type:complete
MSYKTYTTDALVCGSFVSSASDKSYLLLTREAGMIIASARSVREEKSKQRYALQEFSLIRVSLVQGKSGWRIGSVEACKNYYQSASDRATRVLVSEMVKLLRRFLQGEGVNEGVYEEAERALDAVVEDEDNKHYADFFTLRLLAHLGYIPPQKDLQEWLSQNQYKNYQPLSATALKAIDTALEESHL